MIPTKTYPLSAIMGEEKTDKERIAELTDAFNRVCEENADFVAESIKDETRIAELAAQLKHAEGHAAELEAEVKMLREAMDKYSEDEMLLIERCAKVCDGMWVGHGISQQAALCCADAIRALKEEK